MSPVGTHGKDIAKVKKRWGKAPKDAERETARDAISNPSYQVDPELRALIGEMQLRAFANPVPENSALLQTGQPALEQLAEIDVPVLVLAEELDLPEIVELASLMAARLPSGQKMILPGVAHMLSMENPEEFSRLALRFMRV